MKTLKLSLCLVFCMALQFTYAQEQKTEKAEATITTEKVPVKKGIFSFETEEIDYGKVAHKSDGVRTFTFTNTGDAPIVITYVKASCGCTSPSYEKAPVLPGEKGEIKVKYATSRIGPFRKTLTITSNASEARKVVRIKGEVLKPETNTTSNSTK